MTTTGQYQRCISAIHWLEASGALAVGAMFVLVVTCASAAQAQTYTVLHRFQGSSTDGVQPLASVIGDAAGNLYGTTVYGGASGYGVVFKVDETGETVLYSFTGGADGAYPTDALIKDSAGNLYGTASGGGNGIGTLGHGVVFKLDTAGKETVLYSFTGGADGAYPAGVVRDSAGNLYGTAAAGGGPPLGYGVVFKVDTTGKETVLYTFCSQGDGSCPDGSEPSGLIRDSVGNLYGTTIVGGVCCGTVFKLDTTGKETVLYSFTGGADGWNPSSGLIRDSAGNLYGTTTAGGVITEGCQSGCGVVFKLDTTGKETVLYSFTGGADGGYPYSDLIPDSAGNLYGTTSVGGNGIGYNGHGVVFKVDTTGKETVLYSFKRRRRRGRPPSRCEARLGRQSIRQTASAHQTHTRTPSPALSFPLP